MRIAKLLLTVSMSVFLLAVSWSLLTGQLGLPGPAHAQVSGAFAAMVPYGTTTGTVFLAVTDAGDVWKCRTNNTATSWESEYLGSIVGSPITTTDQSASGLKSRYGGNN